MDPARRPFPRRELALLFGILVSLARPIAAGAAYGDLDPGFGGTGFVETSFPQNTTDRGTAAVLQADGKLVVVATADTPEPGGPDLIVLRYETDGSLDPSFGTNGIVGRQDHGFYGLAAYAVALTATGDILVAGEHDAPSSGGEAFVVKFASGGAVDSSFGVHGRVQIFPPVSHPYTVRSMLVQSDGKIVLAGSSGNETAVMRLTPDGEFDPAFGSGGILTTPVDLSSAASAAVLQVDGKILLVGNYTASISDGMFVARCNTDGSLDSSFGSGGIVKTGQLFLGYVASAVTLQTSDTAPTKIVVAGYAAHPLTGIDVLLARYNLDGSLDTTFSDDGIAIQTVGTVGNSQATSVRVVYSGGIPSRILVGGYGSSTAGGPPPPLDIFAARFFLAGTLDTAFDGDGVAFAPFPGSANETGSAMVRTNLADIIVVGSADPWGQDLTTDVATVRFHSNGSLDTTWDTDGVRRDNSEYPLARSQAAAVCVQPDGKIVTAGWVHPTPNVYSATLARYGADGTLDPALSGDGLVSTDSASEAFDVAMQADGRIVTCGRQSADSLLTVLRYLPDGSPDPSFSGDGIVAHAYALDGQPLSYGSYDAVAVQPDQRIVVAGSLRSPPPFTDHQVVVRRLLSDGSFDPSFTFVPQPIPIPPDNLAFAARALAVAPDGRIYVAGNLETAAGVDEFFVLRYLAGGTLDLTFDGDGLVRTPFGPFAGLREMILQPDGRILVGGQQGGTGGGSAGIVLARYNQDGSLDTTFGVGGIVETSRPGINQLLGGLALLPSGKMVVGTGWRGLQTFEYFKFGFVGYHANGNVDPSFGASGFADLDLVPGVEQHLYDLVVDANGDLLFAGDIGFVFGAYRQVVGRLEGPGDVTPVPTLAVAPTPFALGSVFPNPTRGGAWLQFSSSSGLPVEAEVVDVAGRRVRILRSASDPALPGGGSLRWDGDGDDGRRVAAGVYFLRVRQGDRTGSRPVTILR